MPLDFSGMYLVPGISALLTNTENQIWWGLRERQIVKDCVVSGAARDSANPGGNTDVLRPGLLMGKVGSTGKVKEWNPSGSDGSERIYGVLLYDQKMQNLGSDADRFTRLLTGGNLKAASLIVPGQASAGIVSNTNYLRIMQQLCQDGRFHLDDPASISASIPHQYSWPPYTVATASGRVIEHKIATTATSGDNRLMYLRYAMNGANPTDGGECLRAFTALGAAVGTARGAHISLNVSSTGYISGLGVGMDGQLYVGDSALPAGGTYAATQSEIYLEGASSTVTGPTRVSLHRFSVGGDNTGAAGVKNLFEVDALAGNIGDKAAKLLICNADATAGGACTAGLQVCVEGTQYWIPLYSI